MVLWGDHGYKLGDFGRWCKWSNMSLDTHIPMLFSVPNGKKGVVCNQVVEALDIYPTLSELCGFEMPAHVQGQSLSPWLNNPEYAPETKKYAYTLWPNKQDDYNRTNIGYSVKDERFNYVEWVQLNTGEILARELYDHAKDPNEMKNVIYDAQYTDVIAVLAKQCKIRKDATDHEYAKEKLNQLK